MASRGFNISSTGTRTSLMGRSRVSPMRRVEPTGSSGLLTVFGTTVLLASVSLCQGFTTFQGSSKHTTAGSHRTQRSRCAEDVVSRGIWVSASDRPASASTSVLAASGEGAGAPVETINIEVVSAELLAVKEEALVEMKAAETLQKLEDLRRKYMTKKGPVQKVMGQMRLLSNEDKPKLGKVSNAVKAELEEALRSAKTALEKATVEKQIEDEKLDVTLPGLRNFRRSTLGHRHPLSIMTELATDVFVDMGYDLVDGVKHAPEIENDFYCFEALNCPKDHPARDMQDTFYLKSEEGDDPLLLRTHTSSVQIRAMERMKPPLAIVAPGRVYRRDTPDATHNPEFHQIEILRVEKSGNLHLGHLKGTVDHFLKKMFGPDVQTRYRGSYFPFTEPSMEVDIWFKGKWMEVLGCGMVDPRVLEKVGLDPNEYAGFAAGFGVERFAMVLFGVPDLRLFWESDAMFLSQFPGDIQSMKDSLKEGSLGDPSPDE